MQVIILSGKAGVGKDYIANELKSALLNRDFEPEIIAYADALRDELTQIGKELKGLKDNNYINIENKYNLSEDVVKTLDSKYKVQDINFNSKNRDPHYREILQWYGTDVRRKQKSDYWIQKMFDKIHKEAIAGTNVIIIPDARFKNEIDDINHHFNFATMAYRLTDKSSNIDKREYNRDKQKMDSKEKEHLSETDLDYYPDFNLVFDRSLYSVDNIIKSICNDVDFIDSFDNAIKSTQAKLNSINA